MNKKLLILDLDETILYATDDSKMQNPDFIVLGTFSVLKRPGLDDFLNHIFDLFNVAVWTSSSTDYAVEIIKAIFTTHPLEFVWARDRCTRRYDFEMGDYYFVKDLKKVKKRGYDLSQVIMVDNTPRKLERNYGNLIPVSSFSGNMEDRELAALKGYLEFLQSVSNVRKIEKRGWQQRFS